MVALFLFAISIALTNAVENDYQTLDLTLPVPLKKHITAIYANHMYVFGGNNGSNTDYNTRYWKKSLSGFTSSDYTTLTGWPTGDWTELQIDSPSYGPSDISGAGANTFICENQCTTLVGSNLYIFGSTAKGFGSGINNAVYKLDLSQAQPVFAAEDAFYFDMDNTKRDVCVVSIMNTIYTVAGQGATFASYTTDVFVYDIDGSQKDILAADSYNGRISCGCAVNVAGDKIYLFGGKGSGNPYGVQCVDSYDIAGDDGIKCTPGDREFDAGNGVDYARHNIKCVTIPYSTTIECPGGSGLDSDGYAEEKSNSIVWDYEDRSEEYVQMDLSTKSYGLDMYKFYDGSDGYGAWVVLVSGGENATNYKAFDVIQASVRYGQVTSAPTAAPFKTPTSSPTDAPTPTDAPLCEGCTYAPTLSPVPTVSPTTAAPTEMSAESEDSGVGRMHVVFVVALIVAVIGFV